MKPYTVIGIYPDTTGKNADGSEWRLERMED